MRAETDWKAKRGLLAVYKSVGPTSHDVIDVLRRLTGEQKIGHAGTLDPLASGVLVVGIGREATRLLDSQVQKEKEYVTEIRFGATSTTDDEDGEKTERSVSRIPSRSDIETALKKFIGEVQQVPPAYSAIKRAGAKAYKLARKGRAVTLGPRAVRIEGVELLAYEWPYAALRVVTGPGVYIRALARDLGEELGVGGYVHALRRTRVGEFTLKDALPLPPHRKEQPDAWALKL